MALLAMGAAVVLASCSAAQRPPPRIPPTTTTVAPTTTAAPSSPLTGLAPTNSATLGRPAVIVKVDNAPEARPQSGLDQADVVYEEVVEGGVTRYLTVFQSQDVGTVGPVRSVRQTDAEVVHPIGGLFAYSGGIPAFVNDVHRTGVIDVGAVADPNAYHRDSTRPAPHNLYVSVPALRQKTPSGAPAPPPLFTYLAPGATFNPTGAAAISQLRVPMSTATVATWSWDPAGGLWRRATNGALQTVTGGTPVAFTNVIVETVPYHATGFIDPSGAPVPDADVVGTGSAVVLSGGRMARATWTRTAPGAVTSYTDASGTPMALTPGRTWVMLAPIGTATSSG
ncbi:MAG: hypothetical protein DLM54_08215 [Acidimicrobiales bacterium]|nr:MAG: hypothetical protein DLM54_08215 [Acidimicrobiales bacterium]